MAAHLQPRQLINSVHNRNLTELVEAITCLLKTLDPKRPESFDSSQLKQFSPYLSTSLVTQVIKQQKNPNQALFFFSWASKPNPNPQYYSHSSSCYAAITDLLLSRRLFYVAASILIKSGNLNDFFISRFIKAHGDQDNLRGAIFWFHRALDFANGNCLYSYNSLLGVLVRENKIDMVQSYFDQMLSDGIVKPDVSTFTTMIRVFCRIGRVDHARKMFDEMPVRLNSLAFNTLIDGYCKKGDMRNARLLLTRMSADNTDCLPDTITYSTLVHGYCKTGDFDEAIRCMDEMVRSGHEPNTVTYNALVYSLCLRGKVDEARKMVTKMRLNGVKANLGTHSSTLRGFCFAGRSEEAVDYFNQMVNSNVNPDAKCYEIIINEYCKMKKYNEAFVLLKEMRGKGMNPKVSSFNALIRVLVEFNLLDKAVSLLKHMPRMGCLPNLNSYNTLIHSLLSLKGTMLQAEELVLDLRRNGLELDVAIYSDLVKGYCKEGNEVKALQIFHEAIKKGYVINLASFSVLIRQLCRDKKADEAEKIFREICGKFRMINMQMYQKVLEETISGSACSVEDMKMFTGHHIRSADSIRLKNDFNG